MESWLCSCSTLDEVAKRAHVKGGTAASDGAESQLLPGCLALLWDMRNPARHPKDPPPPSWMLLLALRDSCKGNNMPKPGMALLATCSNKREFELWLVLFPSFLLFGILQALFSVSSNSARPASTGVTDLLCTITCLFPHHQPGIHKQPGLLPSSDKSERDNISSSGGAGTQTPRTNIKKVVPQTALGLAGAFQVS